jgi:RNA polymerase sigma-70 factor (ECF subfamily)
MNKKSKNSNLETERLFKEYYPLLCLVSYSIVKDKHAAKDIVQDFFMSYLQKKGTFSLTFSFKAYAIKAVKNLSLLYLEKARKEKLLLNSLDIQKIDEGQTFNSPTDSKKIYELINQLPESRRNIFISFVVQDMSYSEIAETYGITINTVKTQMKRAYSFLRAEASKDFFYLFILAPFLSV